MARATTAARRLLSFVRPGADAEPDHSAQDHRDASSHGTAVPPRPPAPEPVPPRDLPVFEVPAPVLGETCELDADAIEFPNPAVADFVPDLSRPRAAAFKQERTPREVPARSEVPVPVLEVDPARPESDEAPTVHEVDHAVVAPALLAPALLAPALAAGGGAVAPVIGEFCELDTDHVEFPHPAVASFVPAEGRRRGAFGAGAAPQPTAPAVPVVVPEPEPVVAPEPEPALTPEPEPRPVVAPEPTPEPEPVVVPEPEPLVAPEPEPEPFVEPEPLVAPAPPTAPEPFVAPVPVPHRPSPPSVFPEPV
ncbi:hypothetical protein IOC53_16940, partial [Rathayibacter sp. SD072]|nr:hypothetical protein [Rathayibacter sp. SD072]